MLALLVIGLAFTGTAIAQARDSVYISSADTTSVVVKKHSPRKATMYSAVIPGLGQVYNRKVWKVPIIYAGFGTLAYFVAFNTKWMTTYKNAYLDFTDSMLVTDSYLDVISPNIERATYDWILGDAKFNPSLAETLKRLLINNKDYYRRNRDLSYIGIAAWYLLNIIDASVDAHFFDFDISEDLSLQVHPYTTGPGSAYQAFGVRISISF